MALSVLPDLNSQRDDVKLLGILKNDGDGFSPTEFLVCAAIQNRG